jgi:hypothetical protein
MTRQSEAESARYCPGSVTSSRRGADDPDPECCSVPLPAVGHLDSDRHQLPSVSVPGQPEPRRLFLRQFALIPARYSEAFRGERSARSGFRALLHHDVSARRMAPSHPEHVDAVALLIMADVGRKAITQVKQAASEIGGFDRSVQVYKREIAAGHS